jgi:hypothetical protein
MVPPITRYLSPLTSLGPHDSSTFLSPYRASLAALTRSPPCLEPRTPSVQNVAIPSQLGLLLSIHNTAKRASFRSPISTTTNAPATSPHRSLKWLCIHHCPPPVLISFTEPPRFNQIFSFPRHRHLRHHTLFSHKILVLATILQLVRASHSYRSHSSAGAIWGRR